MQDLVQSSPSAMARKAQQVLRVVIPSALLFLTGCAAQHAYRFVPASVTKVIYDPKQCSELPDGRYKCKDVVFTVSKIQPDSK